MNEQRYREAERSLWDSKGAKPTERYLSLKAAQTRVRVLELGGGPPVLFVHGGNTGGSSWAALATGLGGFRSLVLDRPGCGLSDPLQEVLNAETLPRYADSFVGDVLDALELPKANVIATSFGAYLALRSAAAHPERIGKMMLFGWPFAESSPLPGFMRMTSVPGVARLMTMLPVNERSVRMVFSSIGHGPSLKAGRITREDIDWCRALFRETDTMANELAPGRFISPQRGVRPSLILDANLLAKVGTPVRLLWGEKDPFGGPEVARRFAQQLPNASLELLPGAGHAPWLDELDRRVALTSEFLRS